MVRIVKVSALSIGIEFEYEDKLVFIPLHDLSLFANEVAQCHKQIAEEYSQMLLLGKEPKKRVNRKEG